MVADAGLKIFVIAVVGGGGQLEILSSKGGVGRFREDDNVADGRCGLWPVVEAMHEDRAEGAGVETYGFMEMVRRFFVIRHLMAIRYGGGG